jgi:glycoside/pentoside/hexuronide:cation symporter, GPH family
MTKTAEASVRPDQNVSLPRILAFSSPSLPLAALGLPLVVQLPAHYSGTLGLEVGLVGLLFMLVRIFDIGLDVGIGLAMDQTRTRIGRFSPWLLASVPVIIAGTWLLFMAEPGITGWYLAGSLMLTYLGFSMGSLSQMSLGATLTDNYYERSRVFVFWQMGNVIGMLLALALPAIADATGQRGGEGVHYMGWFIIILMPFTALIAARFSAEPPPKAVARRTSVADVMGLMKSKACRSLLAADIILMSGSGVTGGLFLFYFKAVKGFGDNSNILLLIYFVAGLLGAPLWTFIARQFGKHVSLIIACLYAAITQPLLIFLPPGHFAIAAAVMALAGIVYTAGAYLLRAMMADVGDEDLLVTGQDRTGLLYALVTLTGKAGYALAVGVAFLGLSAIGYDPTRGADNSPSALAGLTALFIGLPAFLNLLGAWLLRGYPIDAERTRDIQAQISLKRAQGTI